MHLNAPDSITLTEIPSGRAGISATLRAMRDVTRDARTDYNIIQTADQITGGVPNKDWRGEAEVLLGWVRNNIRYSLDPVDVELVHTPVQTLVRRQGDCDDMSVLLGALLRAKGHPVAFKAVGFEPGLLSHVYVITLIGERWLGADATESHALGWEPPDITDYKIQKV